MTTDAPTPPASGTSNATREAPILLLATFRIRAGHLAPFKESVERAVAFAREHSTQLMVEVFLDEPGLRAYSCQIHPGSASILRHWRVADPYIGEVNKHVTPERLDIYGRPGDAVLEGLRPLQEEGLPITVTPYLCGFNRLPGSA